MLALGCALAMATALTVAHPGPVARAAAPDLGPNVLVFDPGMPTSEIQAAVDGVYAKQVDNEMGSQRVALLFEPGT
jgi:hypothetical protein